MAQRLSVAYQALRGNVQDPPGWLLSMLGAAPTAAGVDVVPQTAVTLSAVYACVQILEQTVGMLPLHVCEQESADVKKVSLTHPLHRLLHYKPNPDMTAYTWKGLVMTHLGLWGNHYSQIVRDQIGRIIMLQPVSPVRVTPMRRGDGTLCYRVAPDATHPGPSEDLEADEVLHIKGLSMNGLVGLSPVGAARESIGLGLGAQEYAARFFSNDGSAGLFIEHPGEMDDEEYERLKKSIEDQRRDLVNKHRLVILEEGAKANRLAIPSEDAQFLTTRDFQVRDIARFYRMPLYKLSENLSAKNANVEQLAIEFISDTIAPWATNIEAELNVKLFAPSELGRYTAVFSMDGAQRGDLKSRFDAYNVARQGGWMSVNEIRGREGMNPIGPQGDEYLKPLNMVPAGTDVTKTAGGAQPAPEPEGGDTDA